MDIINLKYWKLKWFFLNVRHWKLLWIKIKASNYLCCIRYFLLEFIDYFYETTFKVTNNNNNNKISRMIIIMTLIIINKNYFKMNMLRKKYIIFIYMEVN